MMQEQYWQRTRGNVRTALEQTIEMMEAYGLEPEMGHKECGGVRGQIDGAGHMTHVMETAGSRLENLTSVCKLLITNCWPALSLKRFSG